jgi:hypothetical protein
MKYFIPTHLWWWNRQSVSKCWHLNYKRRWITQKEAYITIILFLEISSGITTNVAELASPPQLCHNKMYKPTLMHRDGLSEGQIGSWVMENLMRWILRHCKAICCRILQTEVSDDDGECWVFIIVKIGCSDVTTHSHLFSNQNVRTEWSKLLT